MVFAVSGVVGVVALTWVGWAAWFQSTPDVQSSLSAFHVVDAHSVTAEVTVHTRSSAVSASCLVRASGQDHSVVGELNFMVADQNGATTRRLTLRTEREATSVEMVGCTTSRQHRPQ